MMMNRYVRVLAIALLIGLMAFASTLAAPPPTTTSEMLAMLERTLFGVAGEGAITPRVQKIEDVALGKPGEGTLIERIESLWNEFGGGREGVQTLDYQIKYSQWIADGKVSQGTLLDRLANLETLLMGYVSKDPLTSRIDAMIAITAGATGIDSTYAKLAAGTPVKLVLKTPLRTNFTRPGEKVDLEVSEDVFIGDRLAIPKGTAWQVEAADPTKSDKFDLKNLVELLLSPIYAIDGTPVKLIADDNATSNTQLASGILICQGERPERLGFFGLGNAVDRLLPGSKNLDIIRGTAIVLSVREDVSIMSAKVK